MHTGVAKSEISANFPGVAINDPIYAIALVFDNSKTRAVIITMDTIAIGGIYDISDDFLGKIRARIQSILGIKCYNVLVNVSRTHTV